MRRPKVTRPSAASLAGGNPFLAIISVVCLALSYQQAKRTGKYADLGLGAARGSVGTAAFLGTTAVLGHTWVILMSGVVVAVLARTAFDRTARSVRTVDWGSVARSALKFCRAYRKAMRSRPPPVATPPLLVKAGAATT